MEPLESRCLLSAVMQGAEPATVAAEVSAESEHEPRHHGRGGDNQRKLPKAVLNVAGQWTIVTHAGGFDVTGILNLQQTGKRVTGTLTNAEQPPQNLKGRVVKTTANGGEVKGKVGNLALASKPVGFDMVVTEPNHDTVFHTKDGDFHGDGHRIV